MIKVAGDRKPGLRERKKRRTRATLTDVAVELFLRNGYEGTTVDQIAAIADVSPRTFSRYFATKDAVITTLVEHNLNQAARELRRQPAELNHFEALFRAYRAMYDRSKCPGPGELDSDRLMAITRIIMCSPTLRQGSMEFRQHPVNIALAERMGVDLDDPGLRMVATVWVGIMMAAQEDLDGDTNWNNVTVDDLISRFEHVYVRFIEEAPVSRQPV